MIDDPDDEEFRFPSAGERLYHYPWKRWCTVTDEDSGIPDEVSVTFDDGRDGIVKLKSLEESVDV